MKRAKTSENAIKIIDKKIAIAKPVELEQEVAADYPNSRAPEKTEANSALRGFGRTMTVYAAIKVTCIQPSLIRSEVNKKVKTMPFLVDTQVGCRSIVKAIEGRGE